MKNVLLSIVLCTASLVLADVAPEVTLVTTLPILESYDSQAGWEIKMVEGEIRWGQGRWVKWSAKSTAQAASLYLPARSVEFELLQAAFVQSGSPRKYSLRISGRPAKTNVVNVQHPPTLVGTKPVGRLKLADQDQAPFFRFEGELKIDLIENNSASDAHTASAVNFKKLDRPRVATPGKDNASAVAPIENIMTIFAPVPKLLGIENGFLLLESDQGEMAMGDGGPIEYSPESFLSATKELNGRLKGLQFLIPATEENLAAVFKVFRQKRANVQDRNLALLVRGLPIGGNVLDILPRQDAARRLRTLFVTVGGDTPQFGFATDVRAQAIHYVYAAKIANDTGPISGACADLLVALNGQSDPHD